MPRLKNSPNKSSHFLLIYKQEAIIVINKLTTIMVPRKPNSSLIIAKMKSVCGSGK